MRVRWTTEPRKEQTSYMFKELNIKNIKSFNSASIPLSNFTVLLGTNASGKSNVRDVMRFIHGLSRGYKLAELFGGKYEGSDKIWGGVRGGCWCDGRRRERTGAFREF